MDILKLITHITNGHGTKARRWLTAQARISIRKRSLYVLILSAYVDTVR